MFVQGGSDFILNSFPGPQFHSNRGASSKPPQGVGDNLLRICQEAVTNAVRHAHPTEVEVNLERTPNELRLRVRDDGYGFNPHGPETSKDGHFGLIGIRERVKALGGNLTLSSQLGEGTEIRVTVRLPS